MKVLALGEALVELAPDGVDSYRLGFAGDTLNAAIYLARLGIETAFATALGGKDALSRRIVDLVRREGVDASLIRYVTERPPGLYLIELDADGERRFHYWRDNSPIRDLFASPSDAEAILSRLAQFDWLYLSGITLAVIGKAGRGILLDALDVRAAEGLRVMLDLNIRPQLWWGQEDPREAVAPFAAMSSIVSLSDEDEKALGMDEASRLMVWARGADEVVYRAGGGSVTIANAAGEQTFAPGPRTAAIDTTGAGDAFNAAYLATRIAGGDSGRAVRAGQYLASEVVTIRGAIIPVTESLS